MKKYHLPTIILMLITFWQSDFIKSQTQVYINPNSVFDLGVTTGQLTFSNQEGIHSDQYAFWAERIESKYSNAMLPKL
ncbi:MAG: hypothetical protein HKN76_01720, partial [Saprospiraceae bacterium]|nr:hypothetical protein [Saprospiraceae bacterium]